MNKMGLTAALFIIFTAVTAIAAWLTHVVVCIAAITGVNTLAAVAMLGIGVLIPPAGVIHGYMIWFGAGLF